jgi:hypothetical protein
MGYQNSQNTPNYLGKKKQKYKDRFRRRSGFNGICKNTHALIFEKKK